MALPDGRTDRIDALLWLVLPVAVLFTIPIGSVSNDGLGHSLGFASGSWRLNPNHLLFEPLGAWWQTVWKGSGREPVDVLKLLSALSGALAAALFRWGVAPRVAETRRAANHATAWLAFSSAFLRLWVSDETHMIQMPFVVAVAWLALIYLERPSFGRSLVLGAAVGLAAPSSPTSSSVWLWQSCSRPGTSAGGSRGWRWGARPASGSARRSWPASTSPNCF